MIVSSGVSLHRLESGYFSTFVFILFIFLWKKSPGKSDVRAEEVDMFSRAAGALTGKHTQRHPARC